MPVTTDIFPPFIADLIECRVEGTSQGVDWLNVLYIKGDPGQAFSADCADAAASIFAFYEELAAEVTGDFWTCTGVTFLDRSAANGPELAAIPGAPIVGDAAVEALPLQTQLCVTWRTANSGRRYRGRTYLNGFTTDNNSTTGEPATATITAVQTAVDNFLAALAADTQSLQVLSRGKETTLPDVAPASAPDWEGFATEVTSGLVRGGWDVLRSRRS